MRTAAKLFLVFSSFLALAHACCDSASGRTRVAVIDTGLDLSDPRFSEVLCETGHKDLTGTGLRDINGHGTHIAGLIKQYAENASYCLIIIKYYTESADRLTNVGNFLAAIKHAVTEGARVVNISGGGNTYSEEEYLAIRGAQDVTFVVAAGNEGRDINTPTQEYYPASYTSPNILVVGGLTYGFGNEEQKPMERSNYGDKVECWETGEFVQSEAPNGLKVYLSGSSLTSAIATGKRLSGRLMKRLMKPSIVPRCTAGICVLPFSSHRD